MNSSRFSSNSSFFEENRKFIATIELSFLLKDPFLTPCRPFSGWWWSRTASLKAGAWAARFPRVTLEHRLDDKEGDDGDEGDEVGEGDREEEVVLELDESSCWQKAMHWVRRFSSFCLEIKVFAQKSWRCQLRAFSTASFVYCLWLLHFFHLLCDFLYFCAIHLFCIFVQISQIIFCLV